MNEDLTAPAQTDPLQIVVMLLALLIVIIPLWRIFAKAGYSGWLSLLMVLPFVNLIMLYFLAFAHWPVLKEKESKSISSGGSLDT